jgi:Icc protein
MQILDLDTTPTWTLPFLNALPRRRGAARFELPVLSGSVNELPAPLEALVVASDLQGRELPHEGRPRLLGTALAEELEARSLCGDLPPLDRVGVVLAGDLFAVPGADRRGGYGDVREVWRAFDARARWVVGVGGNHDGFGPPGLAGVERFANRGVGHLLDGRRATLDGLAVGGVSGIVGNPRKPMRRRLDDFLERIRGLLKHELDLLVLHEGPPLPGGARRGHPEIAELLHDAPRDLLVVCGHTHSHDPLVRVGGRQVLNVDGRVVVLRPARG